MQSLAVRVKGRTIADYVNLPIGEALTVFERLELTDREGIIADRILREDRRQAAHTGAGVDADSRIERDRDPGRLVDLQSSRHAAPS